MKKKTVRPRAPRREIDEALRVGLVAGLENIRKHAQAMEHKTAMINDKTGPILANVDALLTRLGVVVAKAPEKPRPAFGEPDIGQGEGCEGGKCQVRP